MAKPWGFHHDNHRVSSAEPYILLARAVYRHRQSIFRAKQKQQVHFVGVVFAVYWRCIFIPFKVLSRTFQGSSLNPPRFSKEVFMLFKYIFKDVFATIKI